MKKLMSPVIFLLVIYACTRFDISDHSASVSDADPEIRRVAVVEFDFVRPERGSTDRGRIVRPLNAGSVMADIFAEQMKIALIANSRAQEVKPQKQHLPDGEIYGTTPTENTILPRRVRYFIQPQTMPGRNV